MRWDCCEETTASTACSSAKTSSGLNKGADNVGRGTIEGFGVCLTDSGRLVSFVLLNLEPTTIGIDAGVITVVVVALCFPSCLIATLIGVDLVPSLPCVPSGRIIGTERDGGGQCRALESGSCVALENGKGGEDEEDEEDGEDVGTGGWKDGGKESSVSVSWSIMSTDPDTGPRSDMAFLSSVVAPGSSGDDSGRRETDAGEADERVEEDDEVEDEGEGDEGVGVREVGERVGEEAMFSARGSWP